MRRNQYAKSSIIEYIRKAEIPRLSVYVYDTPKKRKQYIEDRFRELNKLFLMYWNKIDGDKVKGEIRISRLERAMKGDIGDE